MKKTIAVLGLAAVSNAINNNYVDDQLFGLGIDIKSKVQTADVSHSRGHINVVMKDDADNELHNYYSMPHNKGDIQFNDYTVKKDDADDELFGLGINVNSKVQTANVNHSRGQINVIMKDDADNELNNYYNMPHNKGNIQFNDYSKTNDDELFGLGIDVKSKVQTADVSHSRGKINVVMRDDELFGLDIGVKSKVQTADASHSRGHINVVMKDDADNQLHSYYNMPHNKGNIQFNDYTKAKDDEFFGLGIDVKSKVQTANVNHSRGQINVIMKDNADNELHNYYSMPHNKGDIQFNDYTVKKDDADDELFGLGINVKSKVQTANANHVSGTANIIMRDEADDELFFGLGADIKSKVQTADVSHSRGHINVVMKDDADNQLHSYFNMPHNKGNIQFNDYSKTNDDELFGLGINVNSKVQTANVNHSRGQINVIMNDDGDDELFGLDIGVKSKVQTADASHSRGHINVVMKDDADNEFFQASSSKGNHKDEIEVLRSLLKLATQDKDGNLVLEGVKIGKIPQVKEPKTLKNHTSSKAQADVPKRNFLAF
jgi:hypothetical protein